MTDRDYVRDKLLIEMAWALKTLLRGSNDFAKRLQLNHRSSDTVPKSMVATSLLR